MTYKPRSIYDLIGGEEPIQTIVDSFYARVEQDAVLRPMYPAKLGESNRHLYLFLVQFFGGPTSYSKERGHPRLRMRHFPFAIDQDARDRWLKHMLNAIDDAGISEPALSQMRQYFDRSSTFLINRTEESDAGG